MRLAFLLLIFSSSAFSITAEELRILSGQADREQREKAKRVDINDLNSFLPALEEAPAEVLPEPIVVEPAMVPEPNKKPQSSKYQTPKVIEQLPVLQTDNPQTNSSNTKKESSNKVKNKSPTFVYEPPARTVNNASGQSGSSDVVVVKQRKFGIPLGTWFSGKLTRQTTNSDPGLIEILITQDVVGNHKTLPTGTWLFSDKIFNQGTKRLDLRVIRARLPDGEEIEIDCLVYDSSRVAGLQGIIVENNTNAVASGFKSGMIEAGQAIVNQAGGGTIGGTVISSTADAVANTQQASISMQQAMPFTVHVSPQSVFIQVQETF